MANALHWMTDHLHLTDDRGSRRWQEWKKERQLKAYSEHAPGLTPFSRVPTRLPQNRPRALTFTGDGVPRRSGALYQPKSRLLNLPAEIRLLIWEFAFGGNLVAIYFNKKGRVAHSLVDETNSCITQEDLPVDKASIRHAVDMLGTPGQNSEQSPHPNKLGVMAALRTCRTIYSEGIEFLYSHNTFLFLQNAILLHFHAAILPQRFAAIRSIHVHFQFRDTIFEKRRWEWHTDGFGEVLYVVKWMGSLDHVSIFVQGPIYRDTTFRTILAHMEGMLPHLHMSPPSLYVLRLPHAIPNSPNESFFDRKVEEMLNNTELPFQVVRHASGSPDWPADSDTGIDCGWRQGVLFLPPTEPSDGTSTFVMTRYTVWTPMPSGTDWPCNI